MGGSEVRWTDDWKGTHDYCKNILSPFIRISINLLHWKSLFLNFLLPKTEEKLTKFDSFIYLYVNVLLIYTLVASFRSRFHVG